MMFVKNVFAILIAACLFLCVPGGAGAAVVDLKKINEIMRFDTLDEPSFEAQSFVHHEKPEGLDILSYQIRLPEGWAANPSGEALKQYENTPEGRLGIAEIERTYNLVDLKKNWSENVETVEESGALDARWLGTVARYYGKPELGEYSRIEVFVQELEGDISARNWFLRYVTERGFSLEGMEVLDGGRVEGLYIQVVKDISYVVRMVVEVNGPYVVLVSYAMPMRFWKRERALQEKVLGSFSFDTVNKERLSAVTEFSFAGYAYFDYPSRWKRSKMAISSQNDMEVSLYNNSLAGELKGEITVRLIGRDANISLGDEISSMRDRVKENDALFVDELMEKIDAERFFKAHETITVFAAETYNVKGLDQRLADYEYWLAVLVDDDYYYVITMLTIGRDSGFYDWALNSETFELIVETMRP